jgi:hypothetical protein
MGGMEWNHEGRKKRCSGISISDVERLDPVKVMIENYEPGRVESP